MNDKHLFMLRVLFLTIISPVYVPAVILYKHREEVYDFYREVWQVIKGTHKELQD